MAQTVAPKRCELLANHTFLGPTLLHVFIHSFRGAGKCQEAPPTRCPGFHTYSSLPPSHASTRASFKDQANHPQEDGDSPFPHWSGHRYPSGWAQLVRTSAAFPVDSACPMGTRTYHTAEPPDWQRRETENPPVTHAEQHPPLVPAPAYASGQGHSTLGRSPIYCMWKDDSPSCRGLHITWHFSHDFRWSFQLCRRPAASGWYRI